MLGVQGGYVDSNVRFRASPDRANLTGGTVGVYASYVAGGLFIALSTVKNHIHNVLEKLQVRRRSEAVSAVLEAGRASRMDLGY